MPDRASVGRVGLHLMLLPIIVVVGLCCPVGAQPANGHYELDAAQSKLNGGQGTNPLMWNDKQVGQEEWSATGGSYSFKRHVDHSNNTVSDFQSTWSITGLPPTQLTPDQKLTISASGTASADRNSFDKQDGTYAKVSVDGLDIISDKGGRVVGWTDPGQGSFQPAGQMTLEIAVPRDRHETLTIKVYAGHLYRTTGALDLVYRYKWVAGPAKPEKPPVTPPKPEVQTPPRQAPQVRIALDTMRYNPKEMLLGAVEVRTGLAAGEKGAGQVYWSVFRDPTATYLFQDFVQAGGQQLGKTAVASEESSGTMAGNITAPLETVRFSSVLPVFAPANMGEYILVITLRMADGRSASASTAFDVLDNPRRLVLGQLQIGAAVAGKACTVSLPFVVSGQDAPGAREAVARAWGEVYGLARGAKGQRVSLDEQKPTLAPSRNLLRGNATWEVIFPTPGVYLLSCQVTVPYYGAKEASTFVRVVNEATAAAEATTTDEAGGRVEANGGGNPATPPGAEDDAGGMDLMLVPAMKIGLTAQDDAIVLTNVDPNGPAYRAGVRSGDRLLTINQKSARGLPPAQIRQALTPARGQAIIVMTVQSPTGATKTVAILAQAP